MIHVIATIEVTPGKRDEFLKVFHELMPTVQAEAGCIEYGPTVDVTTSILGQSLLGDNAVVILEKWEDVPALDTHLKAPHMVEFFANVKGLVTGMNLQIVQPA